MLCRLLVAQATVPSPFMLLPQVFGMEKMLLLHRKDNSDVAFREVNSVQDMFSSDDRCKERRAMQVP